MLPSFDTFATDEHHPFHLIGSNGAAAVLIHGFPGTPAEVRPLADALHAEGWSAYGPLLPGFGPDLPNLLEHTHDDWFNTVIETLKTARADHDVVLLIGYSMGGALSLRAVAESVGRPHAPDALITAAPFWRLESGWMQAAWPLIGLLGKTIRPFRLLPLNFEEPATRDGIRQWMGDEIDLNDPEVQAGIRDVEIPVHVFNQLRMAGDKGRAAVTHITLPMLILQGTEDTLVAPRHTRSLLPRLPASPLSYLEFPADHEFIKQGSPVLDEVQDVVVRFAASSHASL